MIAVCITFLEIITKAVYLHFRQLQFCIFLKNDMLLVYNLDFKQDIGHIFFIKGKHVKVAVSKLAMELVLSRTTVFFYEAHEHCDKKQLEEHFIQYGSIYRTYHFAQDDFQSHKTYGFVDFVGEDSIPRAIAAKQQLIGNQFVRVSRFLPNHLVYDLLAISDKHANAMIRKMEQVVPDGVWGSQGFKGAWPMSSCLFTFLKNESCFL